MKVRVRNLAHVIIILCMAISVAGCSTVPKKFKEEVSGIKTRVETLESKIDSVETKQSEVELVTGEQARAIEEMRRVKERDVKTNISVRPKTSHARKESVKEIQTYLKNAGFYTGKIDGIKGRGTREAIKEFQKANGLSADGKVGPKTWEALGRYASAPAKSAGASEEEAK